MPRKFSKVQVSTIQHIDDLEKKLEQAAKWLSGAELPIQGYVNQWLRDTRKLIDGGKVAKREPHKIVQGMREAIASAEAENINER